ncbi:hypothetical protein QE152_g35048 [Popillia japonica]|uniref:Uncharacterized protein n=1 Tax=Popillia japonica TaxID=7064 RepID=A0AAW1IS75_POPJA
MNIAYEDINIESPDSNVLTDEDLGEEDEGDRHEEPCGEPSYEKGQISPNITLLAENLDFAESMIKYFGCHSCEQSLPRQESKEECEGHLSMNLEKHSPIDKHDPPILT